MEWTPDRIRRFRTTGLSLSRPRFAKELGFAQRTIGNAERGTTSPGLALRRALDQALEHASAVQRNRFLATDDTTSQEERPDQGATAHHTRDTASLPLANSHQLTAHPNDIRHRDETLEKSAGNSAFGWFGRGELEAVREMASIFSRVDQRRGGGHARTALVQYLTSDVASCLQGNYTDERIRKDMFSAVSELAYLSGWMAFDNAEHSIARHYFSVAVKLAAEADDPPMMGHILRAMAHQAVDLGHFRQGLELAAASMDDKRYLLASPRERALFGVVHARALGAAGQKSAAAEALIKAEDDLRSATTGDDEPLRVFFFGEASLAHETARTLCDTGDLSGALKEFHRSARTRKATVFTRTHAVTLGYLGAVQVRLGEIDQACSTWSTALDAMDGIRSGRTRQAVLDMRAALSPFRHRAIPATVELDARACAYLNTGSP
ncbi:MAG: helix-turn-helix domain-containing protein [Pseudonocardiaceae bacterium]